MDRPISLKDLLAPFLLWTLILVGCVVGDVTPAHRTAMAGCPGLAPAAATP